MRHYEFYEIHSGHKNTCVWIGSLEEAKKYYAHMVQRGSLLRAKVDGRQLLIHEADEMLLCNDCKGGAMWRNRG